MSKSKKAKELFSNTLLFAISNFGTKAISFFLVPLYTFVLSTKDYGNIDLVSTTVYLIAPILTLNIQDAVLIFCLDKEYNPLQVLKVGIKMAGYASALLGIGLIIVHNLPFFHLSIMYSVYLYLTFIINAFYNIMIKYLKAVDKVTLVAVCGILNTLITCLLNIVLLLWVKLGVLGYLIANISGGMTAIIIMIVFSDMPKIFTVRVPKGLLKTMCLCSMPLIANAVAWWFNDTSDRYIIAFFCGAAANGIYAVSYKIPTILSTIQNTFCNAWAISAITDFDENDSDGFIGNVYMTYSCVLSLVCSGLLMCNIFIARFLYSNEFFSAWKFVPPLLVGSLFNGVALFEGCIFVAVKRTKLVSATTSLSAVVNTICNFVLIPFIGALGAAIATMTGYLILWVIRSIQIRKIIKMKADWKSQIFGFLVLLLQCTVALSFHKFYWQLPFMFLLLVSHRKYLLKVLQTVKNKLNKR